MAKPTVIDFFCGAGGFSEGFRQQGFNIIAGFDKWKPAVETFNHNFSLNCPAIDILKLSNSIDDIERIIDSDVIIGSPPCVSFSNSNKSGKADKSMGLKLTEAFLRIVAVKKYKESSILKAWYMENVPNSLKYIKAEYTFRDLDLADWSLLRNLQPDDIAIRIKSNSYILNSAEYGAAQSRKRVISGEIISKGFFTPPEQTHYLGKTKENNAGLIPARTLREIKSILPSPFSKRSNGKVEDPNYQNLELSLPQLTDHFYDSGLYELQWKNSKYMKTNHPFMGKMSFPENESNPSRTITATQIGTSRESIIYKSEIRRLGDGEYRTPTVREMATLMGFPITYQFKASSILSKARLVGNAVCISVSSALARQLKLELGLIRIRKPRVLMNLNLTGIYDLNNFSTLEFNNPPQRKKGSKFRMHPFKDGNITVTLSNHDIITKKSYGNNWYTSIQYGNGKGFPTHKYQSNFYKKIEGVIQKEYGGKHFLDIINNGYISKVPDGKILQNNYENPNNNINAVDPIYLIEKLKYIIKELGVEDRHFVQSSNKIFKNKQEVPLKQLYALYAINRISSRANKM